VSEKSICSNCKRLKHEHTINELLVCELEINKNNNFEPSDKEWMQYFNEIKNGEFSRMKEQKNSKS